jgi:hypothetical protein
VLDSEAFQMASTTIPPKGINDKMQPLTPVSRELTRALTATHKARNTRRTLEDGEQVAEGGRTIVFRLRRIA